MTLRAVLRSYVETPSRRCSHKESSFVTTLSTVSAAPSADRVSFGIEGLDSITQGGFLRHNHVLLEGPAGAGKTTLALSFLLAGAAQHEPGMFISFERSPSKLLRDAQGFGWDLASLMRQGLLKVLETTPQILQADLKKREGALLHELRVLGVKRLVLDGLAPLRAAADGNYRSQLHQLLGTLCRGGVTVLATSEPDAGRTQRCADERYVFDTVISLDQAPHAAHQRKIEVLKSRGQDFSAGRHTLRLESGRGPVVYPRAESRQHTYVQVEAQSVLHPFGSPDIDALFGGGLYAGSITLVCGAAGTGKTVAGLQFLAAGARRGQAGLMLACDETPLQLARNAEGLGLHIADLLASGQVSFLREAPLDLELDVQFDRIVKLIEERQVERLVVDSLAMYSNTEPRDCAGFWFALAALCKARGVMLLLNCESLETLTGTALGDTLGGSQLVDNFVVLSYIEAQTGLRRAISVPKVRGCRNAPLSHEYVIVEGGLALLPNALTASELTRLLPPPSAALRCARAEAGVE
jgi:circadian clock protein KaiC